MRFTVEYPIVASDYDRELVMPDGMTQIAEAADKYGYDAIAFSEHSAPSYKWRTTGGHDSLDPLTALAFCAAVTRRVRLMTYALVLPHHTPLLAAKALTTVDLLSGGRVTVVAGAGFMRSEFFALNADFETRNELFDEAIDVMRAAWTDVPFSHAGPHFTAKAVASLPRPVQLGGPPILAGGNSASARRRAARHQGWSPLMVGPGAAKMTRTPEISTIEELATQIAQVREAAAHEQGAGAVTTVQIQTLQCRWLQEPASVDEHRDHLGRLAAAGVDQFVVRPPGDSVQKAVDALQNYAETFGG